MIRGCSPLSGVAGSPSQGKFTPVTSGAPANNGDLWLVADANDDITLKYKGSDGVVRSLQLGPLE